jgi:metallo-beta-lactamase family protein
MKITFLGGVRTVTGSCFLLEHPSVAFLVDCGMAQGEGAEEHNKSAFAFDPARIDFLFLTHAHMDHSGLIPKLVRDGFRGRIVTTPATADLVSLMLYDSAHIQQADAEQQTRKALRAGRPPVEPLYTEDDVGKAIPHFRTIPYGETLRTGKGVNVRVLDAGHILGSGSLEIRYQDGPEEKTIVFSGDIGKTDSPIINDPTRPVTADYVVMESTYGNRLHKGMRETLDELVDAVKVTFKRGGNVIIPAFAIGRTQDILYILNRLVHEGRLGRLDVYIDSPLAAEATRTYLSHPELYDEEAKRLLNGEPSGKGLTVRFTASVEESMKLNRIKSHAVIIAGSGMCEGGRIRHHLKHNLWRPECSVLFSGFQAKGTLGRRIVDGARVVTIHGEDIAVKAKIYTLGGFSAHADQAGLLEWLSSFRTPPHVFVVHGEEDTALQFAGLVRERYNFAVNVPRKGDSFDI